jgi:hypothetical protein
MNKIKVQSAVPILLVILSLSSARAQESYRLEYKFERGKTYRFQYTSASTATQEAMGQEVKMTTGTDMIARLVTENVLSDGSMVMVITTDTAVTRSKSPMMDTTMVLSHLIGKRMRITVDRTGKVQAREVIDSVHFERGGVAVRLPQREALGFTLMPEKPVKMGEKWTIANADTMEMIGGKTVNTSDIEYTLVGTETKRGHDCLKIAFTGKTTTTGKMSMMGMEMFTEGNGKVSGTVFFDQKLGVTVLVETANDDDRTMAATGQQNVTMQMSSSGKSTQVLLED